MQRTAADQFLAHGPFVPRIADPRSFRSTRSYSPPVGGDTLFAGLAAAHDGLSDELKELIEGLHCYHRMTTTQNTKRRHTKEEAEAMEMKAPPVVHPLVARHRENGRRYLFVNVTDLIVMASSNFQRRKATSCFANCIVTPSGRNFISASTWRSNTVVVWENNHTLHYPVSEATSRMSAQLWRGVIEATEADRPRGGPRGRI